ncbi:phage tail protein [Escherichia coli]|uniref:phage tail protein n=1 Tax=Escherichia coli TaxID=562 RepID=UPI00207BE6FE|nr:phage tail protein [Escherichia coli]
MPVPWPTATPPAGWLKCDGRAFTKEQYPVLARVYPTLRLIITRTLREPRG